MLPASPETGLRNRLGMENPGTPSLSLLRQGGDFDCYPAQLLERTPGQELLADAELADHGLIALGIIFLEVVKQAASLADQHEKSAA